MVKNWVRENRYTCHQSVNELIEILGLSVLRTLLKRMKKVSGPAWFSIIADEVTDVVNTEHLNLSICWVNDNYKAHEDRIGLFRLPDTKTETLFKVIKDLLIRCDLPLALCQGKGYDGDTNMQGRRTSSSNSGALLCTFFKFMSSRCWTKVCLRNALEICKRIINLIRFSPKGLHLFSSILQASSSGVALKPQCSTRWTARTGAIDAILKDYALLMDTMEEIHATTRDEYGLKAGGYLQSLEKFDILFGFKLAHTLFCAAEQPGILYPPKEEHNH